MRHSAELPQRSCVRCRAPLRRCECPLRPRRRGRRPEAPPGRPRSCAQTRVARASEKCRIACRTPLCSESHARGAAGHTGSSRGDDELESERPLSPDADRLTRKRRLWLRLRRRRHRGVVCRTRRRRYFTRKLSTVLPARSTARTVASEPSLVTYTNADAGFVLRPAPTLVKQGFALSGASPIVLATYVTPPTLKR